MQTDQHQLPRPTNPPTATRGTVWWTVTATKIYPPPLPRPKTGNPLPAKLLLIWSIFTASIAKAHYPRRHHLMQRRGYFPWLTCFDTGPARVLGQILTQVICIQEMCSGENNRGLWIRRFTSLCYTARLLLFLSLFQRKLKTRKGCFVTPALM